MPKVGTQKYVNNLFFSNINISWNGHLVNWYGNGIAFDSSFPFELVTLIQPERSNIIILSSNILYMTAQCMLAVGWHPCVCVVCVVCVRGDPAINYNALSLSLRLNSSKYVSIYIYICTDTEECPWPLSLNAIPLIVSIAHKGLD